MLACRRRGILFGSFILLLVLGTLAPARGTVLSSTIGTVKYTWVSPGGAETLNTFQGPGTFGFTIDLTQYQGQFSGKGFRLSRTSGPVLPAPPPPAPPLGSPPSQLGAPNLNVYFFVNPEWKYDTGVTELEEEYCPPGAGAVCIPSGTTKAFVMIAYATPWATNVGFRFEVLG